MYCRPVCPITLLITSSILVLLGFCGLRNRTILVEYNHRCPKSLSKPRVLDIKLRGKSYLIGIHIKNMTGEVTENDDSKDTEVYIVPTSHSSKESSKRVRKLVNDINPGLVAVELDKKRLRQLRKTDGKIQNKSFTEILTQNDKVGIKGRVLLAFFNKIQESIVQKTGFDFIGIDMLSGFEVARDNDIPLALVDRSIDESFNRFSEEVSLTQIVKTSSLLLVSYIYIKLSSQESIKNQTSLGDKEQTVKAVDESLTAMEKYLPSFKKVFIDERDRHMSSRIRELSEEYNEIVLVIGAAHERGVRSRLDETDDLNVFSMYNSEVEKIKEPN